MIKHKREINQSQKLMIFVLSMSLFGLATMFSELVPSVYIGVVELSIEYFLFIPLSLAMLFDPNGLMWFGVSETFSFSLS